MDDESKVITPENVEYSFELAGIGSRFLAVSIDTIIQFVLIIGLYIIYGLLGSTRMFVSSTRDLYGGILKGLVVLLLFVLYFAYYIYFEVIWEGQTPGKRIMKLRVIKDGGYPLNFFSSFLRNILRIIDILPAFYGIGLISVFFSKSYKRIGDIAAGTIVVKENSFNAPMLIMDTRPIKTTSQITIKNIDRLTEEDYNVIRQYIQRRYQILNDSARDKISTNICNSFMKKLGIETNPFESKEEFIQTIAIQYQERQGGVK